MEKMLFRSLLESLLLQRKSNAKSLRDIIKEMQNKQYTDPTVIKWQATAIALLEHILIHNQPTPINYGTLAKNANTIIQNLYPQNSIRIPTRGHALSNELGTILGILSSLSFRAIGIFLSSIVVNQNSPIPSNGFHELVFMLTGIIPTNSEVLNYQKKVFQVLH